MNLFFRILFSYWMSSFRSRLNILEECITPFRVLPSDLDVFMHMNNGVYFSLQDIARLDLMVRSGFWKKIQKKNWYPVVVSEFIRFKRSLNLGEKFVIKTKVKGWDEKYFYLEHEFFFHEKLCAHGFVKTRFLSKSGERIAPRELLALSGEQVSEISLPGFKEQWDHLESYSRNR